MQTVKYAGDTWRKNTNVGRLRKILNKIAMLEKTGISKYVEAEKLYQLEGQLMEAIGLLKDVVETVRELEPNAGACN